MKHFKRIYWLHVSTMKILNLFHSKKTLLCWLVPIKNLYDDCLNIDKELLSVPEVRSKIQKHIINYFNDNMKYHPTYDKDSTRWKWFRRPNTHHQLYFNDMRYMDDLLRLLLNERRGYTELRDSTLKQLQKNEKQIKSQIAELKQELKASSLFKIQEEFSRF